MNSELREQVSAFVDGELSEQEAELLVLRLGRDASLREYAAKLMALGGQMRGEPEQADRGFLDRVRRGIAEQDPVEAREATVAAPAGRAASSGPWLRLAAGGALAFGVAAVALNFVVTPAPEPLAAPLAELDQPRPEKTEGVEYVVPSDAAPAGLVVADPELAAFYLTHSTKRMATAPGAGRVSALASTPLVARDDAADADAPAEPEPDETSDEIGVAYQ